MQQQGKIRAADNICCPVNFRQNLQDICQSLYTRLKRECIWYGCTRKAEERKRSAAPDGQ